MKLCLLRYLISETTEIVDTFKVIRFKSGRHSQFIRENAQLSFFLFPSFFQIF